MSAEITISTMNALSDTEERDAEFLIGQLESCPREARAIIKSFRRQIIVAAAEGAQDRTFGEWQSIETAPKDGTKVDLLYPYPRGRTINCEFRKDDILGPEGGWYWTTPLWENGELQPESEWSSNCYPNMEPTHWMPAPPPPNGERE